MVTRYLYDFGGGLTMLTKLINSIVTLFVLTAGMAHAQVTYIHEDFQGSVAAESNSTGQIIKRVHYEPFGEQRPTQLSNETAYTGHVYDADLGLTYMGARYYDPTIGRFYSDDPVGFTRDNQASFNRYAYVNNNPFAYTDPTGEAAWFVPPIVVALREVAATGAESAIESTTGVSVPLSTKSITKKAVEQVGRKAIQNSAKKNIKKQVSKGSAYGERAGKKHTRASIKKAKADNAAKNNGDVICESCGVKTTPTTRRTKGSKVDPREGQGDHIHPRSKDGNGATVKDQTNINIKCARCNNAKSNKIE